jgi:putative flippase GtrA
MGKNQVVHRSTIFSSFIVAKLKSNYVYFVRYLFLAGIATIVDFIVLYSLTEYMHVWYFISSALAYFSGMITNFTLNKIFNFANRSKKIVQQFSIFATVALVGLGINQLIIYSLVEYLGFWYMYAKFISVVIVMLYSFIGHKELTFKIFN